MIIEPLRSLINDSSVPVFFENLVEGIVKLSKLYVSTNIQKCSKNLKKERCANSKKIKWWGACVHLDAWILTIVLEKA